MFNPRNLLFSEWAQNDQNQGVSDIKNKKFPRGAGIFRRSPPKQHFFHQNMMISLTCPTIFIQMTHGPSKISGGPKGGVLNPHCLVRPRSQKNARFKGGGGVYDEMTCRSLSLGGLRLAQLPYRLTALPTMKLAEPP